MPFIKALVDKKENAEPADWLITDDNIREEIDRNEGIDVSFNFALCWLRTEILQIKQNKKGYKANRLLSKIIGEKSNHSSQLTSSDQLLATNYFQFLESNAFLKCDKDYLYGDLL